MRNTKRIHRHNCLARAAAGLSLFVGCCTLHAEPRAWDGGGLIDTNWTNPFNWSPDGVPGLTTDVTISNIPTFGITIPWSSTAAANSINLQSRFPITLQGPTLDLQSGDLTRLDAFGIDEPATINSSVRLMGEAVWNIAAGSVTVQTLHDGSGTAFTFTKNGAGFLRVQNATLDENITVNQGTLQFDSLVTGTCMFCIPDDIFVAPGATLALGANNDLIQFMHLAGGGVGGGGALRSLGSANLNNSITLDSDTTIAVDSGVLTVRGQVHDGLSSFSLTKIGAGTLSLQASGQWEAGTFINQGTLQVHGDNPMGGGAVTISSGGRLEIAGSALVNIDNMISLGGTLSSTADGGADASGAITLTANAILETPAANHLLDITSSITDNGSGLSLTKTGAGTAILSGSNSVSGPLIVAGGVLRTSNLPANGSAAVQTGGTLEIRDIPTVNRTLSISGAGAIGLGALLNSSGDTNWTGPITLQADATIGAISPANLTLGGPVSGNFTLFKVGSGALAFTNTANSFGSLAIVEGLVPVTAPNQLPSGIQVTIAQNGALSLSGSHVFNQQLFITGGGPLNEAGTVYSQGNNTLSGNISVSRGELSVLDRLTITGNVSGSGLFKTSFGELVLRGANSQLANHILQGVLTAESNTALASGFSQVSEGATLQLRGGVQVSPSSIALNGHGNLKQGALFSAAGNNSVNSFIHLETETSIGVAAGSSLTLLGGVIEQPFIENSQPLLKVGPGTLVLRAENSYSGGTIVDGGTLSIDDDNRLGFASHLQGVDGSVTVNNGSKLLVTANTTTARTFKLNTGSIQVDAGATMIYNAATVSGGFLRGPGTHASTGGSNFSGVTALPGSIINQSGQTLLSNFTNAGSFTNSAPLNWDGGFNSGAGRLNVNSTLTTTAFQNDGQIIINSSASLTNTGNNLTSTGGSRITINPGGGLNLSAFPLELNGALLVNNGTITGTTNVNFGSLAKGAGVYGAINVTDGGRFSPGNSPGSVTTGSSTWNSGGHYLVEIADSLSGAGSGWDLWNINGTLDINTASTSNGRFTISLASLLGDSPGPAANFDPSRDYSWTILHASGGITGFDPSEFSLDLSSFRNHYTPGSFSLAASSTDLRIHFSAVPEPSAMAAIFSTLFLAVRRGGRARLRPIKGRLMGGSR